MDIHQSGSRQICPYCSLPRHWRVRSTRSEHTWYWVERQTTLEHLTTSGVRLPPLVEVTRQTTGSQESIPIRRNVKHYSTFVSIHRLTIGIPIRKPSKLSAERLMTLECTSRALARVDVGTAVGSLESKMFRTSAK